jgi:hypothetical protein
MVRPNDANGMGKTAHLHQRTALDLLLVAFLFICTILVAHFKMEALVEGSHRNYDEQNSTCNCPDYVFRTVVAAIESFACNCNPPPQTTDRSNCRNSGTIGPSDSPPHCFVGQNGKEC